MVKRVDGSWVQCTPTHDTHIHPKWHPKARPNVKKLTSMQLRRRVLTPLQLATDRAMTVAQRLRKNGFLRCENFKFLLKKDKMKLPAEHPTVRIRQTVYALPMGKRADALIFGKVVALRPCKGIGPWTRGKGEGWVVVRCVASRAKSGLLAILASNVVLVCGRG